MTAQKEPCGNEDICRLYHTIYTQQYRRDQPCPNNTCQHDTRSRPLPALAPREYNHLLQQIRGFHASSHDVMCEEGADELHVAFYKGQWLAYNNVAGLVEHMQPAPEQEQLAELEKQLSERISELKSWIKVAEINGDEQRKKELLPVLGEVQGWWATIPKIALTDHDHQKGWNDALDKLKLEIETRKDKMNKLNLDKPSQLRQGIIMGYKDVLGEIAELRKVKPG